MANKKQEPKIKADDFVEYENSEKPEKYTNFEELCKKVEILKEALDEHARILQENSVERIKKIEAPYFDDDELYRRLDENEE